MLCTILFDIAFLGFGGALLISTVNIQGGLVSVVIGVTAANNAERPTAKYDAEDVCALR